MAGRTAAILAAAGLVLLIIVILVMAAVPPVHRDALTHHLAVPKLWIQNGGLVAMPHLPYSFYPMNIELLYLFPMLYGNDFIPKYIHFLLALATTGMVFAYLQSRTTRALSLLGALLFLSTPVVVKLSISAYVDHGLIFFSWAAFFFLFQWSRTHFQSLKPLVCAAIFCGLGLGTKYNGLIVLFLLTLFVPLMYIRFSKGNTIKTSAAVGYTLVFLLVSMVVFSPWMIRNFRLTGNPVYPLYSQWIGRQADTMEVSNRSMKPWLQRKLIYRESAMETSLIPLRIFFQGQDDDPKHFDGRLNPALCLFPLLLLAFRRESNGRLRTEQLLLGAFAVLFILYASFVVDMRIRYISPVVPPLVILTVFGIERVLRWVQGIHSQSARAIMHWSVVGIVAGFLCLNAAYIAKLYKEVDPLPYVNGEVSREDYLQARLPEYPATQFVNQLEGVRKALALFWGRRLYYFDRPVEFRPQHFLHTVQGVDTPQGLSERLRADGFSHLIVGIRPFETWVEQNFSAQQKGILSQWLSTDCRMVFSENGYAVFQIMQHAS